MPQDNYIPIIEFLEEFYRPFGPERITVHEPWRSVIREAFTPDLSTMKLPYTNVILSAPKKSGKSSYAGGIAMWFASCLSEPGGEILCLHPLTPIRLADGTTMRIGDMVKQKHPGPVMSLDVTTGRMVPKPVTGWYANHLDGRDSVCISHPYARCIGRTKSSGDYKYESVWMTANHPVLTPTGWVQAGQILPGDTIATDLPNIVPELMQMVIGTLLGDSHVRVQLPRFAHSLGSLSFVHCEAQAEYFQLKIAALEHGGVGGWVGMVCQNGHPGRVFQSSAAPVFNRLRDAFYPSGKKIIPRSLVAEHWSPWLMATWIMDDGGAQYLDLDREPRALHLETMGFSRDDVEWVAAFLAERGFPSTVLELRSRPRLRFGAAALRALSQFVGPYVNQSMRYKLNRDAPEFRPELWMSHGAVREYAPAIVGRSVRHPQTTTVYCLDVEGTHNFDANGIIVHNCVANKREQAKGRAFFDIQLSLKHYPKFGRAVKVQSNLIEFPSGARITPITTQAGGEAGANPELIMFDEIWDWSSGQDERLWTELSRVPTRRNSGRVITSYAGWSATSTILWREYQNGLKLPPHPDFAWLVDEHGDPVVRACRDRRSFFYWDHCQRMPWQLSEDGKAYYRDEEASAHSTTEFARIHKNEWSTGEEGIDMALWDACVDDHYQPPKSQPNCYLAVGADASFKKDLTAVMSVYKNGGKLYLGPYEMWQPEPKKRDFDLEATAEKFILDLKGPYRVKKVYYDPYQFHTSAMHLKRAGLRAEEWKQTTPNTKMMGNVLMEALRKRKIVLPNDPRLRKQAASVTLSLSAEGMSIKKEKSKNRKIDSITALSMAILAAEHLPDLSRPISSQIMALG